MGITESPFSTVDNWNIPHVSKKAKENSLFLMKSDGFSVLRGCRNSDHKVHKEQVLTN
jgi:hypothetical protein